ncbi:hypothetical protein NC652_027202 [Populus alba x Populus x berolinensis]|nr:hypothetical protein NC652_027202 [Populus alba x Populus x berolinensis]
MTCAALGETPRHDDSHAAYESRERILEVASCTMKTGPAGRGGVLRDHRGIVRGIFSYSVGNKDSNKTELLAEVKAIDLSSSKNDFVGLNFLVESDSASVRGLELFGSLEYKFLQLEFSIVLSRAICLSATPSEKELSLDFTNNEDEEYVNLPRAEKRRNKFKISERENRFLAQTRIVMICDDRQAQLWNVSLEVQISGGLL